MWCAYCRAGHGGSEPAAEPVVDRDPNAQKADEKGASPLSIQVVASGESGALVWVVKVAGASPPK